MKNNFAKTVFTDNNILKFELSSNVPKQNKITEY